MSNTTGFGRGLCVVIGLSLAGIGQGQAFIASETGAAPPQQAPTPKEDTDLFDTPLYTQSVRNRRQKSAPRGLVVRDDSCFAGKYEKCD